MMQIHNHLFVLLNTSLATLVEKKMHLLGNFWSRFILKKQTVLSVANTKQKAGIPPITEVSVNIFFTFAVSLIKSDHYF